VVDPSQSGSAHQQHTSKPAPEARRFRKQGKRGLSRWTVMVVRSQRVKCHEGRLEVPRNVDDHNALIAAYQEKQLKQLSTLVVQGRLPPMFDD
jgi:hypothetical protein